MRTLRYPTQGGNKRYGRRNAQACELYFAAAALQRVRKQLPGNAIPFRRQTALLFRQPLRKGILESGCGESELENNTHTLKLIDFDSARLIKPCYPNDTEYLGTVGYAAPEQYGEVQTDTRADIYSMGILMNELLTKKRPSELLYPGKLQKVIVKCIQVSPDKRFQTAEKLKRSLHG